MSAPKKNKAREHRISMEIVVDANGPEEQAMGWYYYLDDNLRFPFTARCTAERAISPLREGDEVEIVGMAPESECQHEMFVETPWERRTLAIPYNTGIAGFYGYLYGAMRQGEYKDFGRGRLLELHAEIR